MSYEKQQDHDGLLEELQVKKTQGPSFTDQDVEDCYLAASQYEQSAKQYLGERPHGGLTAEAHDKIATRLRALATRIQAWLPTEKKKETILNAFDQPITVDEDTPVDRKDWIP